MINKGINPNITNKNIEKLEIQNNTFYYHKKFNKFYTRNKI